MSLQHPFNLLLGTANGTDAPPILPGMPGPFALSASSSTFFIISTLRNPNMSASAVINAAHPTMNFQPQALLVLPAGLAVLLFLVSSAIMIKQLWTPSQLLPLKWISLHRPARGKRQTLVGGPKIWVLGCFATAIFHFVQIVGEMDYGQLVVGVFLQRLWGSLAFLILWTCATLSVVSSLHAIPLLRTTSFYTPPASLAGPLASPMYATIYSVLLPLGVTAALVAILARDSTLIGSLASTINQASAVFAEASISVLGSQRPGINGTNSLVTSNVTNLGSLDYAELKSTLADAWEATLVSQESLVKLGAVVALLVLLVAIESTVFMRYWKLVQNAKHEEQPLWRSLPRLPMASLLYSDPPLTVRPTKSQRRVLVRKRPTLPLGLSSDSLHAPASLPITRRPRSQSLFSASSNASSSHVSTTRSHISYAAPSSPSSSTRWDPDLPLVRGPQGVGGMEDDGVPCYPASAFLARKGARTIPNRAGTSLTGISEREGLEEEESWAEEEMSWHSGGSSSWTSDSGSARGGISTRVRAVSMGGRAFSNHTIDSGSGWETLPDYNHISTGRSSVGMSRGMSGQTGSGSSARTSQSGYSKGGRYAWAGSTGYGTGNGTRSSDGHDPSFWECDSSTAYPASTIKGGGGSARTGTQGGTAMSRGSTTSSGASKSSCSSYGSQKGLMDVKVEKGTVEEGGYEGPSSDCLRVLRQGRLKDTAGIAFVLLLFGAQYAIESTFGHQIVNDPRLHVASIAISHLLPLISALVVLVVHLCRTLSSTDEDLFSGTRWGCDQYTRESWWIPTDAVEGKDQEVWDWGTQGEEKEEKMDEAKLHEERMLPVLAYLWD